MINVENLTYDYPMHRALDDVSFRVEKGTITAVVGPTGAGKTTLLRTLIGLMPALMGRVIIGDHNIHLNSRYAFKHIGFVQDHLGIYDEFTVLQSLWYHCALRNIFTDDRSNKVVQIARFIDLNDLLDRPVKTLSKGDRLKLAIGQAIIHSPDILLLDEPLAFLDLSSRHNLYDLLRQLNAQGMTIIVTSHILNEIDQFASNLLILKDGRLIEHCVLPSVLHASSDTRKLKLLLARPFKRVEEVLSKQNGVHNVESKSNRVVYFEFTGSEQSQGKLLSTLIDNGVPLYSLESELNSISQYYMDKLDEQE